MSMLVLALLIGMVAGLRTMTAPAAISWAASLGWLALDGTWLAFLGSRYTPSILTALALAEFVADQWPGTASRTVPTQFGARIASGARCGAAIGVSSGAFVAGLAAGAAGAVVGTLAGAGGRARLAAAFGRDRPAAFIEDGVAVASALLIVLALA